MDKKVSELAKERGLPSWELLEYFHKAGMKHDSSESMVSFKKWKKFLDYHHELSEEEKHKDEVRGHNLPVPLIPSPGMLRSNDHYSIYS
ncbi:MAG: hypothetical protein KAT34_01135 [Candidatus Aminicenantes bacterium]|nr:hypothetical protein [Candidatus Aminicenantes bacterium]